MAVIWKKGEAFSPLTMTPLIDVVFLLSYSSSWAPSWLRKNVKSTSSPDDSEANPAPASSRETIVNIDVRSPPSSRAATDPRRTRKGLKIAASTPAAPPSSSAPTGAPGRIPGRRPENACNKRKQTRLQNNYTQRKREVMPDAGQTSSPRPLTLPRPSSR